MNAYIENLHKVKTKTNTRSSKQHNLINFYMHDYNLCLHRKRLRACILINDHLISCSYAHSTLNSRSRVAQTIFIMRKQMIEPPYILSMLAAFATQILNAYFRISHLIRNFHDLFCVFECKECQCRRLTSTNRYRKWIPQLYADILWICSVFSWSTELICLLFTFGFFVFLAPSQL